MGKRLLIAILATGCLSMAPAYALTFTCEAELTNSWDSTSTTAYQYRHVFTVNTETVKCYSYNLKNTSDGSRWNPSLTLERYDGSVVAIDLGNNGLIDREKSTSGSFCTDVPVRAIKECVFK